jgi:hypothetical protein
MGAVLASQHCWAGCSGQATPIESQHQLGARYATAQFSSTHIYITPSVSANGKMAKLGYRTTAIDALQGQDLTGAPPRLRDSRRAPAGARRQVPTVTLTVIPTAVGHRPRRLPLLCAGKVAIVTGGNSGIGVETVRALSVAGAKVIMCARNVEQGQQVAEEIKWVAPLPDPPTFPAAQPPHHTLPLHRQRGDAKGEVEVRQLDLADLANVQAFAQAEASSSSRLDLLILNAGVMACPLT